ncbi:MAG: hypothetical protein ACJ79A_04460 [Gemmatimonadaceae bacterium]
MRRARRDGARSAQLRTLALGLAVSACTKAESPGADSVRSPGSPAAASSPQQTAVAEANTRQTRAAACPKTGHWIDCQVRERLIRSGLAPRDTTHEALPSLGPAPIVYRLGKGALAVYLFVDSTARVRAAGTLDTVKYVRTPRGPTVLSQATVIENDNLIGLLFSKNEQQIERVSDALTAGAPQP